MFPTKLRNLALGSKLLLVAASTLLLCMLLFVLLSWTILKLNSESQAHKDARAHLSQLDQAYHTYTQSVQHELAQVAHNGSIDETTLKNVLLTLSAHYHIDALDIVSADSRILAYGEPQPSIALSHENRVLLDQRQAAFLFQPTSQGGDLLFAQPLSADPNGTTLLARLPVDDAFAQTLTHHVGADVVLCSTHSLLGTTEVETRNLVQTSRIPAQQLCQTGEASIIDASPAFLVQSQKVRAPGQLGSSPLLTVATIEPLYNFSLSNIHPLLLSIGVGFFILAIGIILSTFSFHTLLLRPLRRLQNQTQALVTASTGIQMDIPQTNELNMLAHSFKLLADSLNTESEALTEQMTHLLVMSDALMSTLNLEHLLKEFVSRMGSIMKAQHVSLLLYGREAQTTPWAVAHWERGTNILRNEVNVYTNPDADITLAMTTKMVALPSRKAPASGKRPALRVPRLAQERKFRLGWTPLHGLHQSRIPPSALRELDLTLAHMAIQRQKIVYGEDIALIYQQRQESWAQLALDNHYSSAITVPLLVQDQAIGAFLIFTDETHKISSRDTFLLSTAAIQTAMAIENALLFAEVKDKNAALERANQLKSQFLANVTHELRTPLHSIISYGALILEGFLDGELTTEQEEHIQFMVRRAEDLSHLVDDMLDLSKIEADRIEVKLEPLKLDSCLNEVVSQLRPMANNKELYLHLEVENDLPPALADGHRVRQVAINLASNALKFTEKGGVTIRCRRLPDRDMLLVSVTDTGIGISPAALSYIFDAFRQADGSTTRRFGGTGLGLTIAKKLVELQGGEIAVESIPGEGTTFSFTLPNVPS